MGCLRKRISGAVFLSAVAVGLFASVSAAQATKSSDKPDQVVIDNVSQNCASIKRSLTQLQHADSRTRTYLGSSYQTILSNFITPLNLRLIKNGVSKAELFTVQSDFTDAQSLFRSNYTAYMRELENLIAVDCVTHPADFYEHLIITRERRAALQKSTTKLSELISKQLAAVTALKDELK